MRPAWRAHASPSLADEPVATSREGRAAEDVPFAPSPKSGMHANAAAQVTPDHAQARATALAFVRALLEADAQALSLLLDDQVTLIAEGSRKQRRDVVVACLGERSALSYRQERRVEALVDVGQIAVTPASADGLPRPSGIQASDLAVQLTPAPGAANTGARPPCLGTLYVRPGPRSGVVAIMR